MPSLEFQTSTASPDVSEAIPKSSIHDEDPSSAISSNSTSNEDLGALSSLSNKINLNTSTRDQLILLPGIGEIAARRIIKARPFTKPEDLLKVQGIGPTLLKRLKPFLVFPE